MSREDARGSGGAPREAGAFGAADRDGSPEDRVRILRIPRKRSWMRTRDGRK